MKDENHTWPSPNCFATERLQLAIFLHATDNLALLSYDRVGPSKVRFVFYDPKHMGNSLELAFDRGATVAGTALFASQKFLRRKMTETLNDRTFGEFDNEYSK